MSRYSDFDGYWLFGFLVADLGEIRIDLLRLQDNKSGSPFRVAVEIATTKFMDQVLKSGLTRVQIREAWMTIRKLPEPAQSFVDGVTCAGHNISFKIWAVMEGGRRYEREQVVFVAPHNAKLERRSGRAAEPGAAADRGNR